jgi:hypothetical protein
VSAKFHFLNGPEAHDPLCGRVPSTCAASTTDIAEVTCKWCLREIDRRIARAPPSGEGAAKGANDANGGSDGR